MQSMVAYTYVEISSCFSVLIFSVCLILLLCRLKFKDYFLPTLIFCIVSMLAWQGFLSFENSEQEVLKLSLDKEIQVTGIVISKDIINASEANESDYAKIIIENSNINGNILLNVYSEDYKKISVGDFVKCRGKFEIPKTARNPRCFNYKRFLNCKRIFLMGSSRNVKVFDKSNNIRFIIYRYTEHVRDVIFHDVGSNKDDVIGLIKGIVLGDKTGINEEAYNRFRIFGTAHILAVSGLHIGILLTFYRRIYRIKPNPIFTVIIVIILICYGSLTRWSPSVFRAVFMSLLYILSQITSREVDLLSCLGVTSIISVCLNPLVVNTLGFQMSYLAVLGIGIISPVISRKLGHIFSIKYGDVLSSERICSLVNGISIYISVQIVVLPYILQEFNYVSPLGFLLNLPVVILAGLIVAFSIVSIFFIIKLDLTVYIVQSNTFVILENNFINELCFKSFSFLEKIRYYIDAIIWGLGKMMMDIHSFAADHLKASFEFVLPGKAATYTFIIAILFFFSESFYIDLNRKNRMRVASYFVFLFCIFFSINSIDRTPFDKANIVMVDVGQGDCIHVRSNGGINVMLDGGGSKYKNIGKLVLKPYLQQNRIGSLDIAGITHEDIDHSKGIKDLKKIYNIKNYVEGAYAGELAKGSGIRVRVLWPFKDDEIEAGEDNEGSSVFRIDVEGISVLVTGDIGIETEKKLIKKYNGSDMLKVDVLKIGHHGSKYSTSDEFLKAVNPKIALIGVGKNNYGHPSPSVIDKLKKNDIILYRTDVHGAIGLWKESNRIRICTMLRE